MNYRSKKENRSLHKLFELIAKELNNNGFDVRIVLQVIAQKGVDMMWSGKLIKELLWRTIQVKYMGERSTTKLTTEDIDNILQMLNKFLAENFHISAPFPSLESLEESK